MKHIYIQYKFDLENEPEFIHMYRRFFWTKWKMEIKDNNPVLYRIKDNEIIRI